MLARNRQLLTAQADHRSDEPALRAGFVRQEGRVNGALQLVPFTVCSPCKGNIDIPNGHAKLNRYVFLHGQIAKRAGILLVFRLQQGDNLA